MIQIELNQDGETSVHTFKSDVESIKFLKEIERLKMLRAASKVTVKKQPFFGKYGRRTAYADALADQAGREILSVKILHV